MTHDRQIMKTGRMLSLALSSAHFAVFTAQREEGGTAKQHTRVYHVDLYFIAVIMPPVLQIAKLLPVWKPTFCMQL